MRREIEIAKVREQVRGCSRCDLRSGCTGPVAMRGGPAEVAVVGEAPGRVEDLEGRPFVGPAGTLAGQWLTENVGVEDVAWLNVVSCFPHGTPTAANVEACRPNLEAQLAVLSPRYLLLLGSVALSAWAPSIKISEARGHWFAAQGGVDVYPEGVVWALATYHPAAVLRNRSLQGAVDEDLDVFGMVVVDGEPPPLSRWCVRCERREVDRYEYPGLGFCRRCDPEQRLARARAGQLVLY